MLIASHLPHAKSKILSSFVYLSSGATQNQSTFRMTTAVLKIKQLQLLQPVPQAQLSSVE